jgi:SOS-response transcriptional repressor LexA
MNQCGSDLLALRVLGDSMLPEFKEGHIIIIDPSGVVENGSYVLAVHNNEYIFRQLIIEEKQYFLKPLNIKYPVLQITDLEAIQGIIVQRAGTRRKEHKHYV